MLGFDNPIHIAFLLIVLLLVFGAKRLPEMGQSLGHGLRGFKDAIGGEVTHLPFAGQEQSPPVSAQPVQTVGAQPDIASSAVAQPVPAQPHPVQPVAHVASLPDDRAA